MRLCIVIVIASLAGCSDSGSDPSGDGGNGTSDGGGSGDGAMPDAMIDCNEAITCPAPGMSAYTFCGRIVDIETDAPVTDPSALTLQVFDAAEFTNDPATATGLTANDITIDSCGRFRAVDVSTPATGTAILAIDDDDDVYVMTAGAVEAAAGQRVAGLTLRVVRTATDDAWSAQGGLPPGATFSSLGSWIAIFTHNGQPVEGVELMRGVATDPTDSFYFGDQDSGRTTISTVVDATGANGTGLMIDSPIQSHSGTGAEEMGCEWPTVLAFGLEDVFFVSELPMLLANGDEACP